jgi:hypothetical protein
MVSDLATQILISLLVIAVGIGQILTITVISYGEDPGPTRHDGE